MELAILSPDNFPLLDKMRKELIEVGYKDTDSMHKDLLWNDWMVEGHNGKYKDISCLLVQNNALAYHNHDCNCSQQVTLTASNYNEILTRCKEAINTTK